MVKIKNFFKSLIKKTVKRIYRWCTKTDKVHSAGKKKKYTNDIKYNYAIDEKLSIDEKRIMVAQIFYGKNGFYPNIEEPKRFTEKLLWLKLNYKDDRITICCDKYRAKAYIDSVIGPGHVVPLIKKYENVCDIDIDELPDQFVLKVNWCTGFNIIVKDKTSFDLNEAKAKLDFWCLPWKCSYYGSFNWGYKNMAPVVFAEKYMDLSENNMEYKMFCFNGRVRFTLVEVDPFGNNPARAYYDRDWNEEQFQIRNTPKISGIEVPNNYDNMLRYAEKLAEPFPFVRIDFYNLSGDLYIGEMTFYSGGGFSKIEPDFWDINLGNDLDIKDVIEKMRRDGIKDNGDTKSN